MSDLRSTPNLVGPFVERGTRGFRTYLKALSTLELYENLFFLGSLIAILGYTIFDFQHDVETGAGLFHLVVDGVFTTLAALGLGTFWLNLAWRRRNLIKSHRAEIESLHHRLQHAHTHAEQWRRESDLAVQGLAHAIDRQFDSWRLTRAEKEVGLLLLKGLSLQEIADLRQNSERTVRSHANSLYAKAEISGRAELSAFFLEDLLLPVSPPASVK